jgi:hypothetical protein
MTANAQGLTRTIPAEIKRKVRQRCGFGCVICGATIYEYEHFDPEFARASSHDPSGITLLCPTHHAEKTRGVLPIEVLRQANADPVAHRNGHTSVCRPYFEHVPSLAMGGGMLVHNTPIPIQIRGAPLIEFKEPEAGSDVTVISAEITSDDGSGLLTIIDNEWIVASGVWDYEWIGQRMTIRDSLRSVALQITVHPPELIQIDRLRSRRHGFDVLITDTELRVNGASFVGCVGSNSRVGLSLG